MRAIATSTSLRRAVPRRSATEGETLYGGNDERVVTHLSVWGYWIMPDEIPGEKTKRDLAQTSPDGRQTYARVRARAVGPAPSLAMRPIRSSSAPCF
jgi:hypothetical protein